MELLVLIRGKHYTININYTKTELFLMIIFLLPPTYISRNMSKYFANTVELHDSRMSLLDISQQMLVGNLINTS